MGNRTLIEKHYNCVAERYPGLNLNIEGNNTWILKGILHFYASFNNEPIEDKYEILISIPKTYPEKPPTAMEIGGRIPSDFHHYTNDILCLGTPHEINSKFRINPTLLAFIEDQLIPYLYSFSYQENHKGKMPYGEWEHGGAGIIQYYKELLKEKSDTAILGFLQILADDNYKGHFDCPCGSGSKLRNCHGNLLLKIKSDQGKDDFLKEYIHVYEYLNYYNVQLPNSVIIKRFFRLNKKKMKALTNSLTKR